MRYKRIAEEPEETPFETKEKTNPYGFPKWITEFANKEDMAWYLGQCEGYNRFNPPEIAGIIRTFPEDAKVALAREGSHAIYVETEKKDLVKAKFKLLDHRAPDELGVVEEPLNGQYDQGKGDYVRAWWD